MRISITIILSLFVQLLQAQFTPGKILAEIGDPWDLELGDFNNDGFMDVIFSSTHDSLNLYLLLNDTQSGFNPPIAIIEEEGGDGYYFAVGELNNDGNLDVIGHGANGTYVFYGNGDGSFQSEVVLDGFAALPRNYMIIADVDNNGHQDIISSYGGFSLDGAVQWISNNGNGDFEDTENLFEDLPKSFFIEVADLDGDEFPEILVSSETPNPLFYFEYNGVDGFERTDVVSGMNNAGRFHIQDLNDDGLQDILVGEESSSELYFHFQAQPTNDTYYGFEILEMEKTTFGMDVGDLNGDGLIDFVTGTSGTTSGAGKVYFYPGLPLNDRRPDFDDPIILLEDISTRDLEVVDIDNDNDLDIIVSSRAYSWQNVLTENQIVLIQNLANDIAISGFVYHDENVDGSFELGEQIIQNTSINIVPTATAVFTQPDGIFNIYVAEGTYEITPNYGKCYGPSSQPETITVDFDGVNHIDDLEFGLEVISNEENLDISIIIIQVVKQ